MGCQREIRGSGPKKNYDRLEAVMDKIQARIYDLERLGKQ
jgi:hypothetical protein